MALKEQDIVFTGKDSKGNTIIQMPITRIENVEGAVKTVNGGMPDANGNVTVTVSGKTVGDQWISVDGTIPEGGLAFNGNEVSRSIYADLYNYVVTQGRVIAEKDWQSMYSSNNGNVPYYSSGDGSSTFRLPTFKSYPHFVASGAGKYTKASSLDHIHAFGSNNGNNQGSFIATNASKSFRLATSSGTRGWNGSGGGGAYDGDASTFSANMVTSLPGESLTPNPESTDVIVGVIAIASATADADTSLSDVLAAIEALESRTLKIVRYS